MNIKTKLLNTLLLSTSVLYYSNGYANEKKEYFDMLDFSKEILDKCSINTNDQTEAYNSNNSSINAVPGKYGAIYYTNTNKYLVDENNNYFYDWNTLIDFYTEQPTFNTLNLVTKTDKTSNEYIVNESKIGMRNEYQSCNLILAKGIITSFDTTTHHAFLLKSNNNLLVFGTLINNNTDTLFTIGDGSNDNDHIKNNVIFGPNSCYELTTLENKILKTNFDDIVLYPGCKIIDTKNNGYSNNNFIFQNPCNLYLNRYTIQDGNCKKIRGTLGNNVAVIFPSEMNNPNSNNDYTLKEINSQYMHTDYFPLLYWEGYGHYLLSNKISKGNYCIQSPEPIHFNNETKILELNKDDKFSKYDVKFLKKCMVDNYRFSETITAGDPKNNFIDVNTLEELFMDGRTYRLQTSKYSLYGLLKNMPNYMPPGLIGDKDIIIHDEGNSHTLTIHGNINNYKGTFYCLPEITTVVFPEGTNVEDNKWKISKNQRFEYTGIGNDGIVTVKEGEFGSGIQTIQIGEDYYYEGDDTFDKCISDDSYKETLDYKDEGKNLNWYNKIGVIWNIDKFEECFKDGNTYKPANADENAPTGILQYMPNGIFASLKSNEDNTGNENNKDNEGDNKNTIHKNITIDTKETKLMLFGSNDSYKGTMTIPENVTDVYSHYYSLINNIQYNETPYSDVKSKVLGQNGNNIIIDGLTFKLVDPIFGQYSISPSGNTGTNQCTHILDITQNNEITENLTSEKWKDCTIILKDIGDIKHNTLYIKGDNSGFNGVLIATPGINDVIFGKNSFVRIVKIDGTQINQYVFDGDGKMTHYNDYGSINIQNGAKVKLTSNSDSGNTDNSTMIFDHLIIDNNSQCIVALGNTFVVGNK